MVSTSTAMMGLMLFLEICLCIFGIAVAEEKSIDQRIADASESSREMDFLYDSSNGIVKTEMDMMFTIDVWRDLIYRNNTRSKRKAIRPLMFRWKDKEIPYTYEDQFTKEQKLEVQKAMDDWNALTCIRFREANNRDINKITIRNGMGCSSFIGMQSKPQDVLLAKNCRWKDIILHELGHAIGLFHEQTRVDRDNYVSIIEKNVIDRLFYNFEKRTNKAMNLYGVPYDYRSIMHYGAYEFSVNGERTIETKDKSYQQIIGKAKVLSFSDVKLVNAMYDCSGNCPKKTCPRNGFVAKDCECYCPDIKKSVRKCSDTSGDGGVTEPEEEEICRDSHKSCAVWAQMNECKLNPRYMLQNCEKSCGVCKGGKEEEVKDCKDDNTDCKRWASLGECSKNPVYMLVHCKLSCKQCNVEKKCEDGKKLCPVWAKAGHCTVNAAYMLNNCKKSCSQCTSGGEEEVTVETKKCDDSSNLCPVLARIGLCTVNTAIMFKSCKKSCSQCTNGGKEEEKVDINEEKCNDSNTMCPAWAKAGHCQINAAYMLNNCKKSCSQCTKGGKEEEKVDIYCLDGNKHCQDWAENGECTRNPSYMLNNCKKSCNNCGQNIQAYGTEPCTDEDGQCEAWTAKGECKSNPDYMLFYCKKSCHICE